MRIKVVSAEKKYKLNPDLITIYGIADDQNYTFSLLIDQIDNLRNPDDIQKGSIIELNALDSAKFINA